jgi:hypothetical protein
MDPDGFIYRLRTVGLTQWCIIFERRGVGVRRIRIKRRRKIFWLEADGFEEFLDDGLDLDAVGFGSVV